jgi:C-terminal processing protease CtpA/Prc
VIVGIDGEPVADRVKRLWPYFTASTEIGRKMRVAGAALRGPKDSVAALEIRDAKGLRSVSVPRVAKIDRPGSEDSFNVMDGNIGYVDLSRLTVEQVDGMFDALMKTKAIVFDMRGYPQGTAWKIAPRINTRKATVGATFRRRQFSGANTLEESESGFSFEQPLLPTDKPLYQGKTVMLIDERAISQAEHTCLFFEAANGTTFVGSPTAGANGDVTFFPLPGGFRVMFTGHDVRHADGRQLQRVGIQPDIAVTPTIAGLRAGKDEVLERAIRFVQEGK